MSLYDEQIEEMIATSISIIESEIKRIKIKQKKEVLEPDDANTIINYLKTLVIVQKEKRTDDKEKEINTKKMSDEEIENAILNEAEKIKAKNANK